MNETLGGELEGGGGGKGGKLGSLGGKLPPLLKN